MTKQKQYTTDLKDEEWAVLAPYLKRLMPPKERGRPLEHELRKLIDAMRYLLRNGCTWRDLPGDFPPWQSVYYHYSNVYVAWDNSNTHEDDEVEEVLRAAAGRLILLYLPTYSPWLNPIEMLWRHFRREVTHCELFV